jgi:hypothetical protein
MKMQTILEMLANTRQTPSVLSGVTLVPNGNIGQPVYAYNATNSEHVYAVKAVTERLKAEIQGLRFEIATLHQHITQLDERIIELELPHKTPNKEFPANALRFGGLAPSR